MEKIFSEISQNSQQNTSFYNKETPEYVFSSEFCKIFKSIYFLKHLKTAATGIYVQLHF